MHVTFKLDDNVTHHVPGKKACNVRKEKGREGREFKKGGRGK